MSRFEQKNTQKTKVIYANIVFNTFIVGFFIFILRSYTVDSEIFARILFSRKALKDI